MEGGAGSDPPSNVTSFFTGSHGALEDEAVVLKDYVVGQRLGEGAYGSVYSIKHTPSGKTFALKILQKEDLFVDAYASSPLAGESSPLGQTGPSTLARTYAEAFERKIVQEATVMQALQHPHVVNFYRFLNSKEAYYFIMELAEGGELFDLIISSRFFAENEARYYFQQLISAIEYCHRNGVAHGDLKAENLLLSKDNRLLVCDFGFSSKNAKENVDDPEATLGTGDNVALVDSLVNGFTGVGTLHYMSPEAIRAMTERAVPDVLLTLGLQCPTSTASSPDTTSLTSPGCGVDGTYSFADSACRRETVVFTDGTHKSFCTLVPASLPMSNTHGRTRPAGVGSPTATTITATNTSTNAHTASTASRAFCDPPGLTSSSPSPSKALKTSYSMADMCSLERGKDSNRPSRLAKMGGRQSSERTLGSNATTTTTAERQHSHAFGETSSAAKTMSDRWSAFMKSLTGHGHHERTDSGTRGSLLHGMRKSRSTGSLCTDEAMFGSPLERKKLEKDLKKKKKKGDLGKTGSCADCHSTESFTRDGTELGCGSGSTPNTRTPDPPTPMRQARVVVDPYQQDLWSAGVILFFMLTGRLPFDGRDDEETIYLIERDQPSFNEEEQERISPEARALALSMLAKEPTDRPSLDDIIISRWFAKFLNVDTLFEDRKDELNAKLAKAGIIVDSRNAPSFYELPCDKTYGGIEEQVIDAAFQKIATDGYDNITRDELRDMMTTLHGDHVDKKDVSELIGLFTGDDTSDAITYKQFRDAWVNNDLAHTSFAHNSEFQLANIVGIQMDDVERQLVRQLRIAFDSVNDDHDGMISASQLRRVFERFGCAVTDGDLDSLIDYFDNRPSRITRSLTNASIDSTWTSPNRSFTPTVASPLPQPQSPTPASTPAPPHEKGITFDAFVQGIVHKDILLRHPLGRRLAAATNLAALFQSHNVTECVRHGFLVSGLQNVILQKLTSVSERLVLLYTDETVSHTENIYSFRYLGSSALMQGATIDTVSPALASSTVLTMSASMPVLGASLTAAGAGSSLSRLSHSRRATLASSLLMKQSGWATNGGSLETPVPSVSDFVHRHHSRRKKRSPLSSSGVGSPQSATGGTWPVQGTLSVKSATSLSSPVPITAVAPSADTTPAQEPSTRDANSTTPPSLTGHHQHHHHHHHRAHYQHANHRPHHHHPLQQSAGGYSYTSQSSHNGGSLSMHDDTHEHHILSTGEDSGAVHHSLDLSTCDGESQVSLGRDSNSIVATSESGEASAAMMSSRASLGQPAGLQTPGGAPPSGSVRSPVDAALPQTAPGTALGTDGAANVPAVRGSKSVSNTASPSSAQSLPLATATTTTGILGEAVSGSSAPTHKMGTTPSFADNLFAQDHSPHNASTSRMAASAHDDLSRSMGASTVTRGHTAHANHFPHRSLAFGASGAVPQVNGVCDLDIILAPAFLGYTVVRFRRIHGKTNDFHEAVIYVSNLLDIERQQASEDTLPRGESELM